MDLPPLNFDKEKEDYEAFEDKREVNFPVCKHKDTKIVDGWLKCKCGSGWTGPMIHLMELKQALANA